MRVWLRFALSVGLLLVSASAERPAADTPNALALLERYAHGEFTPVVAALEGVHDFDGLLKQLKDGGDAWIAAGGPDDRPRRQLAAATFALEAARLDAWTEWKTVQRNPPFPGQSVYWHAPPLLIKWASALFSSDETPRPIERFWQLAALSVAERAEDFEFLIGSPFEPRGNPGDEIAFLKPIFTRFPRDTRFVLGQAIALEWRTWPNGPNGQASGRAGAREAQQVFQNLLDDPAVGGEAAMRLGALRLRSGATDAAIDLLTGAEARTHDPYVLYLARYFKGQALERAKRGGGGRARLPRCARCRSARPVRVDGVGCGAVQTRSASRGVGGRQREPLRASTAGRSVAGLCGCRRSLLARARRQASRGDPSMRPTRVLLATLVIGMALLSSAGARPQTPPGQTTFRTATDVVTVDVSVRRRDTPVAGLTAADFVVLDNGVRQHVDSVETEAVPVDVTLIVDTNDEIANSNDNVKQQAKSIASRLRPDDELRVLRIDSYVTEVLPMQRSSAQPVFGLLPTGHLASVNDALAAALMFQVPLNRRHLILAITNGIDTMSTLDVATVRDIARQSNATLHIAQVDMAEELPDVPAPPGFVAYWDSRRERERAHSRSASLREQPSHHFWEAHYDPPVLRRVGADRFAILREAARVTGGDLHAPGLFERNAADVFDDVFKDFRQNYLLRYTAQGVKREGWHDLKVTIPSQPGCTIHARNGYGIEGGGK
jgi:hypothetical protein